MKKHDQSGKMPPKPGFRGGFRPRGGHMGPGEKPKDFKGALKMLLKYLKPYRAAILTVLILSFGSAAFSIIGPKILGNATTILFEGLVKKISGVPGAGIDFGTIGNTLILLLGLYLASSIFSFLQGFIMAGVSQRISYRMRKSIAEKINRLPLKYFDTKTHGEILSRVTNDVDTVSHTLNQSLSQILSQVTMMIGVFVMMLTISWIMTLAALLIIPISTFFITLWLRDLRSISEPIRNTWACQRPCGRKLQLSHHHEGLQQGRRVCENLR